MNSIAEHVIIGAGPAGLAMAGRLRNAGLPFRLLEAGENLGNSWRNHYRRLHLHTVKRFSHLPHLPFPGEYPKYVPRAAFVTYLEQYAQTFGIEPEYGCKVSRIRKQMDGWEISLENGDRISANKVFLCTGLNRQPAQPQWPGQDTFAGIMLHSSSYLEPQEDWGRRAMVVGMGNSGAEIALDLCEHGFETAISVRGAVNIVRRDTLGRPVQVTSMLLSKLPNWLSDPVGRVLGRITVGNLSAYGIQQSPMAPAQQLRTLGKTPMIDVGTIDRIKSGEIRVFGGIRAFRGSVVEFVDGKTWQPDVVVLGTGYRPGLAALVEGVVTFLDMRGNPKGLWSEDLPGLYFLGFNPYSSGILHGIHEDSGTILKQVISLRK